jgi:hypothetical protein
LIVDLRRISYVTQYFIQCVSRLAAEKCGKTDFLNLNLTSNGIESGFYVRHDQVE